MGELWRQQFSASYIRSDDVVVLNDADIPFPEGFISNAKLRSNVIFPPNSRAGDHYHKIREEVFVGFGTGLQLLIESPSTHEVRIFDMDPGKNNGQCVAFGIPAGLPHAVRNLGPDSGFLIEFASHPQEKVDHRISTDET